MATEVNANSSHATAPAVAGRIIAIDYGMRRTGLATTDEKGRIALPLATVPTPTLLAYLQQYATINTIAAFVIGKPTTLQGEPSAVAQHITGFARILKAAFPQIQIHHHDERFTSTMAHQALRAGGASRKQRQDKALVDQLAATLLLQSFLERPAYLNP